VESQGFSFHRFMGEEDEDSVDLRSVVPFNRINTLFFLESPRNDPERLEPEARKGTFEEVTRGLEPCQMEEEIARCFRCGTCIDCGACLDFCPDLSIIKDVRAGIYSFDADYCKGCGVCSVACARGVVEMVSEKP
jgi:Pyruvate/2-oxoacid:ferredoxin oxidoreductase delta subunit